jgi:predicted DNA-binding protein (MmcQ/YjbR family)
MSDEDPRLARTSRICLALPEAERELSGRHATFRVRRRTFAYYLDDHQGDGILGVAFKAPPGMNEALAAGEPDRFYLPAYIAHHGWLGLRLDTGRVDWQEVEDMVTESYALVAPKRLVRMLEPS